MKKVAILLSLLMLFAVSCAKSELESQVPNVSSTPCKQDVLRSGELSDKVDVEFTNKGVQIVCYNFEVPCDFTTVNVTHTFVNGVLNITQKGFPNQANCVCYSDVSYTIEGIAKNEVNVIFINGVQVYCHNDNDSIEKLDTVIMLKMNESFVTTNSNNTMTVSFVEVVDNRCAKSQCHLCWGSKADVLLSLTDSESTNVKIDLSIIGCVDELDNESNWNFIDTLGYRFKLSKLSPYPDIEPINENDYIAKIKITKL